MSPDSERPLPLRSFEEVCAPIAHAVAESGMSDEELDAFFEEIRDEIWNEKHPIVRD
jgi:hypothetical protein